MQVTKASLAADIAARDKTIEELKKQLSTAEDDARLFSQDANRNHKNWQDCEARLTAIRTAIGTALEVNHKTGVEPKGEYYRGQFIEDEGDRPEQVRLLRHLHKLADNQPPF